MRASRTASGRRLPFWPCGYSYDFSSLNELWDTIIVTGKSAMDNLANWEGFMTLLGEYNNCRIFRGNRWLL